MSEITTGELTKEQIEASLTQIIADDWFEESSIDDALNNIDEFLRREEVELTPKLEAFMINEVFALVGTDGEVIPESKLKMGITIAERFISYFATYFFLDNSSSAKALSLIDWELLQEDAGE